MCGKSFFGMLPKLGRPQLEKFVNDITFFSFFFVSFYIRLFWSYQGFIKNKSQSLKKFIIWFSIIVSMYLIEN